MHSTQTNALHPRARTGGIALAKNAEQIKVAANGGLYLARLNDNPELPEDSTTPLDPLFKEVGYAGEDGVTFNKSEEVEDVNAWQSPVPVRRIVVSRDFSASTNLIQWNRDSVALAFGGGEWSEPAPEVYKYLPPSDYDPLTDWVAVIEAIDGTRKDRWVIERCNITGDVETQAVRNAAMSLSITLSALTPDGKDRAWSFYSNDPAFKAVGS